MKDRSHIDERSSVCALIPHYECEEWLGQAIDSLLEQTRPLDAIIVIDDGSARPPTDLVKRYRQVTLLGCADNGGPYRLIQAVIEQTGYDAYLFQDADDWSATYRLEALLETAARARAELVGSHEVRVHVDDALVERVRYPLDVNAALEADPRAFPLLHPTSLVGRDLVIRLGGYATGMRFSGDAEFLRRAAYAARIVNADGYGYFRRRRAGSLTTAPSTALGSLRRRAVHEMLARRAVTNAAAVAAGHEPDVRPWRRAALPELRHLAGPDLGAVRRRRRRPERAGRRQRFDRAPTFIVGAPRSGHGELAFSLAQHRDVGLITDIGWLVRTVAELEAISAGSSDPPPEDFRRGMATALGQLAWGAARCPIADGSELMPVSHPLFRFWPAARFIHVVCHPDEVVASLTGSRATGGDFFTPDLAYRRWLEDVEAGVAIERRGGASALRIAHDQLVGDPRGVLEVVGGFLGLEITDECVRSLRALAQPVRQAAPTASRAVVDRAHRVWTDVLHGQPQLGACDLEQLFLLYRVVPPAGSSFAQKVRRMAASAPPGSTIAVVSRGDPNLVDLDGRTGWHFPRAEDGVYAGFHPPDSDAVLGHLAALAAGGATHLLVPATAFWWLDFYDGLRRHVGDKCRLIAFEEGTGALWSLTSPATVTPSLSSAVGALQ